MRPSSHGEIGIMHTLIQKMDHIQRKGPASKYDDYDFRKGKTCKILDQFLSPNPCAVLHI